MDAWKQSENQLFFFLFFLWILLNSSNIRYLSKYIISVFTSNSQEKAIDSLPKSSQVVNRSNGPPYVQSVMMESDDGISYKG